MLTEDSKIPHAYMHKKYKSQDISALRDMTEFNRKYT